MRSDQNSTVQSIVAALDSHGCGPHKDGAGYRAKCPCHNGITSNSLVVFDGGKMHCHGCDANTGDVLRELGLVDKQTSLSHKPRVKVGSKLKTLHPNEQSAIDGAKWSIFKDRSETPRPPDRQHQYHDADGKHVGTVLLWKFSTELKEARQIRRYDNGWVCNAMETPRPLYQLPMVIHTSSVIITEGEKCADALQSIGLIATSPTQGAKSPQKSDWSVLKDKSVTISVDNDDAGHEFGKRVIDLIRDIAISIKIVTLKDDWPELPTKGDAADWVEQFKDVDHEELQRRFKLLPDHFATIDKIVLKKKPRTASHTQSRQAAMSDKQQPSNTRVRSYDATDLNDIGNAEHYATAYENELRYCAAWRKWLVWDGCRWKIDDGERPLKLAKELVQTMFNDAMELRGGEIFRHVCGSATISRLKAMITLAGPELPIRVEDLDQDSWVLNCRNGTVDLTSGKLMPHNRDDGITKLCPTEFQPDAESPVWTKFLSDVFADDAELISFVQRLFGQYLTGDVS